MRYPLQLIDEVDIGQATQSARRMLKRRALVGAAAAAVPVPGFDWAVDAALLSRLIPAINAEFGLTPDQLARLDPQRLEQVQHAVALAGSMLVGKLMTKDLLMAAARLIGVRLASAQAVKWVPLAGQAASAMLGYAAIRYFGEKHIKDCVLVVQSSRSGKLGRVYSG
ncbi:MAG: hypothetical protein ACKVOO_01610 [Burkholderiaceae bacterium]